MTDLEAELEDLWKVGGSFLPGIGQVYIDASYIIHGTLEYDNKFKTRVYTPWVKLRDEFLQIICDSGNNVIDTGQALCNVADSYATSDNLTADEIKEYEDFKDNLADDPDYAPPLSDTAKPVGPDDPLVTDADPNDPTR